MKKYVIYESTDQKFEGTEIEFDDEVCDREKLAQILNKNLSNSVIIKNNIGYIIQNEHFTLKLKEVN